MNRRVWMVCPTCSGEGKHSRHIGAITSSEWEYEWSPEEQEAYLSGAYDVTCEACQGQRVVPREDEEEYLDA